jgi:hypothetical protein
MCLRIFENVHAKISYGIRVQTSWENSAFQRYVRTRSTVYDVRTTKLQFYRNYVWFVNQYNGRASAVYRFGAPDSVQIRIDRNTLKRIQTNTIATIVQVCPVEENNDDIGIVSSIQFKVFYSNDRMFRFCCNQKYRFTYYDANCNKITKLLLNHKVLRMLYKHIARDSMLVISV